MGETMTRTKRETTTIQTWPGGQSFEYRGDPDGPSNQRSLRAGYYRGEGRNPWRKGTEEEWRTIRIAVRAEMYARRDVLQCVSALVDDLIKAANSGDLSGDLAEGFGYDEIRGLYRDTDNFTADECREYADEHGLDLPAVPTSRCADCDGDGKRADIPTNTDHPCETCEGRGEIDDHPDHWAEDDSRYGWLTEAREVCREHAQDNPAEVYEWWLVSRWLCDQLAAIGEVTINNGYGHFWGRTCTGQGLIMDGTLQQIAARYEDR